MQSSSCYEVTPLRVEGNVPIIKVNQRRFLSFVLSLCLVTWYVLQRMCLFSNPVTYAAMKGYMVTPCPKQYNLFYRQIREVSLYCWCFSIVYLNLHFPNWCLDEKKSVWCVMSPRPNLDYRTWSNVPFPQIHFCKQYLIWEVKKLTYMCYFHIDCKAMATVQKKLSWMAFCFSVKTKSSWLFSFYALFAVYIVI